MISEQSRGVHVFPKVAKTMFEATLFQSETINPQQ